jgi:hypothetical protein
MEKSGEGAVAKGDISLPVKSGGGLVQKYKPSPKKEGVGKKSELRKIVNLSYPNGSPYGWAFFQFYDAKEFLMSLSNRDGMITFIGGIEYRPFSNLTTKWLIDSEFSNYIWVIRIT